VTVAVLVSLTLLLIAGAQTLAAPSDNTGYPVFVHRGTCGNLVEEPLANIGNATAPMANDDDQSAALPGTVLTTSATIDQKFDDLRQQPHAIVVHESATNFSTIAACGDIGGTVDEGKLMIGLYPVGGTDIIGVAVLEEGSGVPVIGKDKTRITVYLLNGMTPPTPAPVPATPASTGTPVADAPAAPPTTSGPVYTTGPVTIWLTDDGFIPDRVLSAVGHDLTVTLINSGSRPHSFTIDRLNIDAHLAPGETKTVHLNGVVIGEYTYYSDLPADKAMGMSGHLSIFI
jgi:plastocyanin